MKRTLRDRVGRLSESIALRPIPPSVVDAAFEHFRSTGVLPGNSRVAHEVALLTLSGRPDPREIEVDVRDPYVRLREVIEEWKAADVDPAPEPPRIPLREVLLNEAVHGSSAVREAARLALQLGVQSGADVTSGTFLADRDPPAHGCLGFHLLGFPERVAMPPYEEQARRLFARQASIRARIDQVDADPFEAIAAAIHHFEATGDLPDDPLLRDCVLADAEFVALLRHRTGEGDAGLLAVFDTIATGTEEQRADALCRLQALVRAGRLFPEDDEIET